MNRSMIVGLVCGLFLGSGCATQGGVPDYDGAERDFSRAQHTVDNWLRKEPEPVRQECRTFEWKNIYGQVELRTVCE